MSQILLALGWLACLVAAQLLPHPAGVSPVAALALFAGAVFRSRATGLALALGGPPLAGLGVGLATGDFERSFHALAPAVYGSWALSLALGRWLGARRNAARIAGASIAGSLAFFAITNYAVWASLDTYPATLPGLGACYLAGLPLLARGLLGDLVFAGTLFGAFAWVGARVPARRAQATA